MMDTLLVKWFERLGAREKLAVFLGALAILLFVADLVVVKNVRSLFQVLDIETQQSLVLCQYHQKVVGMKGAVEKEYREMSGRLERASSQSVAAEQMRDRINELARQYRISIDSINQSETVPKGYGDLYSVQIGKFEGDMANLLRFLDAVETCGGMLRVAKLSLGPGKEKGQVKGSVFITQVMLSPESASGTPPEPSDGG